MHKPRLIWLLACGMVVLSVRASPAAEPETIAADEQTLQAAGLRTDGPALLHFLRQRSRAVPERDRLRNLMQQITTGSLSERDQAAAELLALGAVAVPLLRRAAHDPDDREVAARAVRCLQLLQADKLGTLPAAAARLVARRKPAGAAETLLAYLPFAEDDSVLREVQTSLAVVAVHDGKPSPVLVAALTDPVALRRAVAAEIIVGSGDLSQRARVGLLLKDPKPMVRLRVALALAGVHTEEALPVLIALLSELPESQAKQAEEFLLNLAGDQAPKVALGITAALQLRCRDAWSAWWNKHEPAALLEEFRKRTLTDAQRDHVLALIRRLGDESFDVREKATAELLKAGKPTVFLLRQAVNDSDAEISRRVQKCLATLESEALAPVPAAVARLVALRKPAGAAEVVLAYVPFADEESTLAEVHTALVALAFHEGKPNPTLVRALGDRLAPRRAAAAAALCEGSSSELRIALRKLLTDEDAGVRFRVALGLAGKAGDREAVPALIALLGQLPAEQNWQVEDYLFRLAGEKAPSVTAGTDPASWQKYRAAWSSWWREQGPRIEVVKLDPAQTMLGYNLIVSQDNNGMGKVMELGPGGKVRWQITGLQSPVDARVVPGNKVLIAEHGQSVSERDFQGKIIWQLQDFTDQPVNIQRLHNGHTFIATEDELRELDRAGKKVFTFRWPASDIMSAYKFRDGQMVFVTRRNQCHRLDATGKAIKTFAIPRVAHYGCIDGLEKGRLLVPQYHTSKVIEYDLDGKVVAELSAPVPCSATRLPNGHTLVASNDQRVIELDRSGKIVWEYKDDTRPWRARRR